MPLLASAAFFSLNDLLSSITPQTAAAGSPDNSQVSGALAAAINLNPDPQAAGDPPLLAGEALLPQLGPDGSAADIAQAPQSSAISVYTVHDGDTLSGIAAMFGVSVNTIIGANDLAGQTIYPGEELIILPITGVEYTTAAGDTLASIAKKFNSDAGDIAQYNDLSPGATLAVGTQLIIPNGELSTPVSGASSSAPAKPATKPSSSEPYLGGSGPSLPGYFAWPLAGGVVTQGLHGWNAVDIGAPTGTSIYAAAAGTVIIAKGGGAWNGGYGNYVVISHANGTQTLYAHMSRVLVSAGQNVAQGDVIGKVGATGLATGPHLHFEVRGAQNPFASLSLGSSDPY